ncbi:hypothetical protein CK203_025058 [Vitis vinifera]|uniref:DUF4216 domain-containing protein n=1 Tax=Vitis vinifera TaxID=29760 RepID=A0A438J745_VITVI|nr:hypothetical protein CK203_025058 [Vitis vinifera]
MGLRCELGPRFESNRTYLPPTCYTLSKVEKKLFCQTLSQLKVPEGYCSNMRNLVSMEDLKLYGLKSHDYHALMQHKVVDVPALDKLQNDVVIEVAIGNNEPISETLKWIAHGPSHYVSKYHGYVINGCRYHSKERDDLQATQNSGVSIVASTMQIASAKDQKPVFVFKCDWVDNKNGIKVDDLGFTLVDFNKIAHKSDPFILASQAKQVFYVQDQLDPRWTLLEVEAFDAMDDSNAICIRGDCEGIWIENKSSVAELMDPEKGKKPKKEVQRNDTKVHDYQEQKQRDQVADKLLKESQENGRSVNGSNDILVEALEVVEKPIRRGEDAGSTSANRTKEQVVDASYDSSAPLPIPIPGQNYYCWGCNWLPSLWPTHLVIIHTLISTSKKGKKQKENEVEVKSKGEKAQDIKNFEALVGLMLSTSRSTSC